MSPLGRLAASVLALLVLAGALIFLVDRQGGGERPQAASPGERPELLLLTSLPLIFPEDFTLQGGGSPALSALERHFRVVPVGAADLASLDGKTLLLMAQPNAQTAEALVDLDRWVRGGGRLLLLADPALQWPSDRPIGDILRPIPAFADTGLLAHWGLRLDPPDRLGPASFGLGDRQVRTLSAGTLVATGPDCSVEKGGHLARCSPGEGAVTVIADADFIGVDREGIPKANLDALVEELRRLSQ